MQIKSHAQKVLKRMEAGEDVFGALEENVSRLQYLVAEVHASMGLPPPATVLQPSPCSTTARPSHATSVAESATTSTTTTTTTTLMAAAAAAMVEGNGDGETPRKRRHKKKTPDGTEHLAASALCQLAGPDSEGGSSSNSSVVGDATDGGGADYVLRDAATAPDMLLASVGEAGESEATQTGRDGGDDTDVANGVGNSMELLYKVSV